MCRIGNAMCGLLVACAQAAVGQRLLCEHFRNIVCRFFEHGGCGFDSLILYFAPLMRSDKRRCSLGLASPFGCCNATCVCVRGVEPVGFGEVSWISVFRVEASMLLQTITLA